jgi:hypothetical protein
MGVEATRASSTAEFADLSTHANKASTPFLIESVIYSMS